MKSRNTQIEDPTFGRITYEHGIWTSLPVIGADSFMVTIDAPPNGPSELQRTLFDKILRDLASFREQSLAFMKASNTFAISDTRFTIYSIEIASDENSALERFVLELSDEGAAEIHRVSFDSGIPIGYGRDD